MHKTTAIYLVLIGAGLCCVAAGALAMNPQVEVAERAAKTIREKIDTRHQPLTRRARALYRMSRKTQGQNLLSPSSSHRVAMTSNLKWALKSDLKPYLELKHELANVELELEEIPRAPTALNSAPLELRLPVAGATRVHSFGSRSIGRLKLSSRGVRWATKPNTAVVAPASGTVVFSGKAAGVGMLVLEHRDTWIVLAPISGGPSHGTVVSRGDALGHCSDDWFVLEARVANDRGGIPFDPGPFVAR